MWRETKSCPLVSQQAGLIVSGLQRAESDSVAREDFMKKGGGEKDGWVASRAATES